MKLEDITVALRPREPWEAVDLGCSMARRDFGQLMALWAATVLPVWLVLGVVMHDLPAWHGFVVWWLKPLYDRVPLFFLSRAAFGVRPGFRETWKAWPRLWSKDLFSALILRRLSLMRSFALPVIMLEGQKGKAVRQRIDALATDGGGSGTSVTWVFLKLEMVAWLGLLSFTYKLIPDSISPDWSGLFNLQDATDFVIQPAIYWWVNICYLVAITLVEPFYVGAGFGLYLNCRTRLEGWDVELAFRRLAARVSGLAAAAVVVLLMCLPLGVNAASAVSTANKPAGQTTKPSAFEKSFTDAAKSKSASTPKPNDSPETRASNAKADEILKRPEFKVHTRTSKQWHWDWKWGERQDSGPTDFSLLKLLAYVFFWSVLAGVIAAIVIYLMRNRHLLGLPPLAARPMEKSSGPRVVMGMDIGRDSLPDDIVATAQDLWKTKGSREALSLLYRGTLSRLMERHRLLIRDSDTEDDCLALMRQTGERQTTGYFSQLTNAWVCEAYAGMSASEAEFAQLCAAWPFQKVNASSRSTAPSLAIVLALVVPFIASCSGHWEEENETLGYKGKARIDPFLAAEMLLKEYGHKAERTPSLGKMPEPRNGIIFISSEAGVPEGRAKQLLSWVSRGGHLVYCVAGAMPYNDFSKGGDFFINFGSDERPDPILTKLDVKLHDRRPKLDLHAKSTVTIKPKKKDEKKGDKPETTDDKLKKEKKAARKGDTTEIKNIKWGDRTFALELSDKITFTPGRNLRPGEWSAGDEKDASILSLHFGAGRITLLNHARPLRSKHLGDNDHAAWLVALTDNGDHMKKDARFVVGMSASFWTLLRQRAWMPLVGLACVIAIWLWKNGRRFGPIMPLELSETKHFTDHVSALGQFFFRLRRGDVLLKAAADAVRLRFRKKFPQLASGEVTGVFSPESALPSAAGQNAPITLRRAAAGTDDAMIQHLAAHSGLAPERVAAALAAHPPGQNHQLVRLLQDLQSLRQSL